MLAPAFDVSAYQSLQRERALSLSENQQSLLANILLTMERANSASAAIAELLDQVGPSGLNLPTISNAQAREKHSIENIRALIDLYLGDSAG
jgi:hypothetical protein